MLRRSIGDAIDEQSLIADWGTPPFALLIHGAPCGDGHSLDPDEHVNWEFLFQRLRESWIAVTLMPAPRHMKHAVVLIAGSTERGVEYLDPAEADGEPRLMTTIEFVERWTGELLIPRKRGPIGR
jgi:hypothetical protein